jgi:hypothetical protein
VLSLACPFWAVVAILGANAALGSVRFQLMKDLMLLLAEPVIELAGGAIEFTLFPETS